MPGTQSKHLSKAQVMHHFFDCFYLFLLSEFRTLNMPRGKGSIVRGLIGGPASLSKYHCGVEGCLVQPRSNDLAGHYRNRTNFKLLEKLYAGSSETADKILPKVDSHTRSVVYKLQVFA